MKSGLIEAFMAPLPCTCLCHGVLTIDQRAEGIRALFRFDDAMRGWGYAPLYDLKAHILFREAQAKNDPTYRGVAVRDSSCLFQRLVGFAAHETLHALNGDTTKANYGIPFGLPYGVPEDLPEGDEAAFLDPFNRAEARAWLGPGILATALWGITWDVRTARDVGTYGFPGGNAIVPVAPGFRAVPHWDNVHHRTTYLQLARKLEREEESWFSEAQIGELVARFEEAEARGAKLRKSPWPHPMELARKAPKLPGRNDDCLCGSGVKYKKCHGKPEVT